MRQQPQHHFLAYTIEHILGSFFVITVAMFLGYAAYAQTGSTASSTSTSTINFSSTYLQPPTLFVPDIATGQITLHWEGPSMPTGMQHGYAVYRNSVVIAITTVNSYIDSSGLTPGQVYTYYIKTIDTNGGSSLPSNSIIVTMPVTAPIGNTPPPPPSTTSPPASQPPPITETLPPVTFAVTVAPQIDCVNGKAMTEVFFITSDATAGSFKLYSSDVGINNVPLEWGRHSFPNGKYGWSAVVQDGRMSAGDIAGTFTLAGVCEPLPTATTSQPVPVISVSTLGSDAFPLKYPVNTAVVPIVAIDNVRVAEGETVSGIVTFSVTAKGSTRTIFVLESSVGTKQYIDKQLGVIHKDGTDEWSTLWSTTNLDNGVYALAALMDTSAGTMISKRFNFTVKNVSTQTGGVPVPKKPILKVYMNNSVFPSGAALTRGDSIEFRVGALNAKKVSFYGVTPSGLAPTELGRGVIDDLLSGNSQDIWTTTWDTTNATVSSYKVFARVLYLDGTAGESISFPLAVVDEVAAANSIGNVASDTKIAETSTLESKEEILGRISSPEGCTTAYECKVFCASAIVNSLSSSCATYTQHDLNIDDSDVSLADDISGDDINRILSDPHKRSDIPMIVINNDDLLMYCADLSHTENCEKMLTKNDLASPSSLAEKKLAILAEKLQQEKLFGERIGARVFYDSDGDSLSDYDEVNIYHTDPVKSDTDNDGVPDSIEIVNHTNPHSGVGETREGTSTKENISEGFTFENPLITGALNSTLLSVKNVQVAEVGEGLDGTTTAKKIFFSGNAPANSYVTLFVFSSPIIVTIKADAGGAWTYTLDKELENGSHQVVSAITDEGGRILAKSDPLPFVKVAAAVSIGSNALLPGNETPGFFTGPSLYAFIAILIGLFGVAFSIIGFMVKGRPEGDAPLFPPSGK